MVLQSEVYPGYPFPQQGYSVQPQGYYSTNDYYSTPLLGMPVMTNPSAPTPKYPRHQMVAGGGYAQQHHDWYGEKRPQNGMHDTTDFYYSQGSQGQMLPYNSNDGYDSSGGKHSNTTGITGYTANYAQHVPMGTYPNYAQHVPMGIEAMKYEYSSWGNERERFPFYYQNSYSQQNGYPKAEWNPKGVDD
ncbi:unnamed protein product [Ilex paraguariensis]|uniref:Uncharacterized protein n=1 Tax=Ilex paraguariensis TaxID=185542 RepID=A0ABC8SA69_9AQUA